MGKSCVSIGQVFGSSAGASIMNSDQPWYVMHLNEASTSEPFA